MGEHNNTLPMRECDFFFLSFFIFTDVLYSHTKHITSETNIAKRNTSFGIGKTMTLKEKLQDMNKYDQQCSDRHTRNINRSKFKVNYAVIYWFVLFGYSIWFDFGGLRFSTLFLIFVQNFTVLLSGIS